MQKIENFTDDETRFLSNFYPHKKDGGKYPHKVCVTYNGHTFDCVETAYQAAKYIDSAKQAQFVLMSPYEAKAYWENRSDWRPDWHDIKLSIMQDLVWQKFSNSPELAKMLLETGDAVLEEGNDWGDTFWGICDGKGENHLGKILMHTREKLRK